MRLQLDQTDSALLNTTLLCDVERSGQTSLTLLFTNENKTKPVIQRLSTGKPNTSSKLNSAMLNGVVQRSMLSQSDPRPTKREISKSFSLFLSDYETTAGF